MKTVKTISIRVCASAVVVIVGAFAIIREVMHAMLGKFDYAFDVDVISERIES